MRNSSPLKEKECQQSSDLCTKSGAVLDELGVASQQPSNCELSSPTLYQQDLVVCRSISVDL